MGGGSGAPKKVSSYIWTFPYPCNSDIGLSRFSHIHDFYKKNEPLCLAQTKIKKNSSLGRLKHIKKKCSKNNQIVLNNNHIQLGKKPLEIYMTWHAGLSKSASLFSDLLLWNIFTKSKFLQKYWPKKVTTIRNKK